MKIRPYLGFNGQCEEAFHRYARIFNANPPTFFRFGASPMAGHYPDWADKVMHVSMPVGDQMLMGCDAPPPHYQTVQGMRVCLEFDATAEAERVYAALSEGGQIEMPLQETFWSYSFAMIADRFGTPWMINVAKPM